MIDEEEYLISYSNLKSNLFTHQKEFLDSKNLDVFYNNSFMGMPICLPSKIRFFDYSKAKFFEINKKKFSKKIFNTNNLNYIGNKKFFRYGNIFASNVFLKKKYIPKYKFYFSKIKKTRKIISSLNKMNKKICSMQIRNVPHFGHEAVFKHILKKFDTLVLNPIFGVKKKNDFSDKVIFKSLKFIEKKYNNIKFLPVWSSFHYGGPREAMHHLSMRENLGFDYFYIGRDHAGAQNLYKPNAASIMAIKYKKKFKIKSFTAAGAYWCIKCKDYVIKGMCSHKEFINISGTKFRYCLNKKLIYQHSDKELQKLIYSIL